MGELRNQVDILQVGSITQDQLNRAGRNTYLDNRVDLADLGKIAEQIHSIRTFGAWPDPGSGAVATTESPTTSLTLAPSEGNQYSVYAISIGNATGGTQKCQVQLYDGVTEVVLATIDAADGLTTGFDLGYPIILTSNLYLRVVNVAGGNVTISAAYYTTVRGT
jgi:hypothetical protein